MQALAADDAAASREELPLHAPAGCTVASSSGAAASTSCSSGAAASGSVCVPPLSPRVVSALSHVGGGRWSRCHYPDKTHDCLERLRACLYQLEAQGVTLASQVPRQVVSGGGPGSPGVPTGALLRRDYTPGSSLLWWAWYTVNGSEHGFNKYPLTYNGLSQAKQCGEVKQVRLQCRHLDM